MDKKKSALIIGGIAALGIAAYFFLGQKTVDDFGPSGGGASGQAAGYEGGGADVSYLFGGDTIQFPGGGGDTGFNDILKALMSGGTPEGESKKESNVLRPGEYEITSSGTVKSLASGKEYTPLFQSGSQPAPKKETSSGGSGIMTGLAASVGGVLDFLFKPVTTAVATGTTVKKTITGGGSSSGVLGTSSGGYTGSSGFVAPAPVAVLGQSGGTSGVPGSAQAAQYVQAQYGQPGSGYVVRGYSLTGVPLYKPAG
jgi:hypothetical protein